MPVFRYTAADQHGRTVKGRISANTGDAAGTELDRRGLVPLQVQPLRTTAGGWLTRRRGLHWSIEDKVLFTRKFASLLSAGLPLLQVLDLIVGQTKAPGVAAALRRVGDSVANGATVDDAMAAFPRLFDPIYLGAIRTGEATGHLDTVLDHTATFLERDMITTRKVKEALRYPAMVVVAIIIAAAVVLKFVVPQFMSFYSNFGSELPGPTRMLLTISELTERLWWLIIPLALLGWAGWKWTKSPTGRVWRDRLLLRLPLLGPLFLKVAVSRFARLFSVLYSAGVPATSALETVAPGVGNVIVAAEITAMRDRLSAGASIGEASTDAVMPELVYQMIDIGFESGEVERMMIETARHFEQEIDYDVRRLTDRLQPILLIFLAAGVLFLALAVLLPMWNLITIFQQ